MLITSDYEGRRVSVVGCECGSVQLSVVNSKNNTILSTYSDVFDGPISQVMFFSLTPKDILAPEYVCKPGKFFILFKVSWFFNSYTIIVVL